MSLLRERINSYQDDFWDFKDFKNNGVHSIARYPAMMVAPMQGQIIEDVIELEDGIKNILDPFHGSGTTLIEGKKIGLEVYGIDINPLANLITRVKVDGVKHEDLKIELGQLSEKIKSKKSSLKSCRYFPNINKWFREDIIQDLNLIREVIISVENKNIRQYFWLCLTNIIHKYSNSRKSTFKLHIKPKIDIQQIKNNVLQDFLKEVNSLYKKLPNFSGEKANLYLGDIKSEIKKIPKGEIDLICTSPPYGDNATTVTYGQFSILKLLWIDTNDLGPFDPTLISNFSRIDYLSLGGKSNQELDVSTPLLDNALNQISEQKQKKVRSFFKDYFQSLNLLVEVLRKDGILVLTLGNRRVDNIQIPLDEITKEYLMGMNMQIVSQLKRRIFNKRMPNKVSRIKGIGAVKSIQTETILIFKKGGESCESVC